MTKICISYCGRDGECGMDFDEDDVDDFGDSLDMPSSCDNGYCMDDGEDKGCDEFYSEDE